jgi:hypothetical protein
MNAVWTIVGRGSTCAVRAAAGADNVVSLTWSLSEGDRSVSAEGGADELVRLGLGERSWAKFDGAFVL